MAIAGADLPAAAKHTLGIHNVCVHPASAILYAVHHGRFTFLVRRPELAPRRLRWHESLDGSVDLAGLEGAWHPTWLDDQDDFDGLVAAHEAAGRGGEAPAS